MRDNKRPITKQVFMTFKTNKPTLMSDLIKAGKTIDISVEQSEDKKVFRNRCELERDSVESLLQVAVIEGNRHGMMLQELVEKVRRFWVDANDHSI